MSQIQNPAKIFTKYFRSYPAWPTPGRINASVRWWEMRRCDAKMQLCRRNPEWKYLNENQKQAIAGQIGEIADVLENGRGTFGYTGFSHVYVIHGMTNRQWSIYSDIDVVLLTDGLKQTSLEKISWKGFDGKNIDWHIWNISLQDMLQGTSQEAIVAKTDIFRGACIFGQDIFAAEDAPGPQHWMCFAGEMFFFAAAHAFEIWNYPERFWIIKAAARFDEAVNILRMVHPDADPALLAAALKDLRADECRPYFPMERTVKALMFKNRYTDQVKRAFFEAFLYQSGKGYSFTDTSHIDHLRMWDELR